MVSGRIIRCAAAFAFGCAFITTAQIREIAPGVRPDGQIARRESRRWSPSPDRWRRGPRGVRVSRPPPATSYPAYPVNAAISKTCAGAIQLIFGPILRNISFNFRPPDRPRRGTLAINHALL